jgi:hypothetical protein
MTQTVHLALNLHALQREEVWLKSGCKEGRFTLEVDIFYRAYLASNCRRVTEPSGVALLYATNSL